MEQQTSQPTKIFVTGIDDSIAEKDLYSKFEVFGEIKSVNINPKGFCFIDYMNEMSAKEAIENMNYKTINDKQIVVKPALDKKRKDRFFPRDDFGGGNNGDRKGPSSSDTCHNCQGTGHWASQCKEERKPRYFFLLY